MKKAIIILVALIFLSNALTVDDFPDFTAYVTDYNKTYNATELVKRQTQYNTKILELIQITEYTPAVNNFTDWYPEEIEILKGLKTLQNTARVIRSTLQPPKVGAPSSVDWRTTAVTTPKNQGYCGSCWAFAATAYSQSKLIIDNRYDNDVDLSEQKLLQCTQESSCDGGYLEYAFKTVLDKIPFETVYPYSPQDLYGSSICDFPGVQIGNIDQNYYDLSTSQLEELVAQRPIAISLSADNWQNYGSGVFSCPLDSKVNHAVLLVGYTSDYWIVKNSWGTNWGENGYIRVTKTLLRDCNIGKSAHRTYQLHFRGALLLLLALIGSFLF